jgi:6-pyruvoyltetrahydropterin/6-carboxytetrahydropterin synthase
MPTTFVHLSKDSFKFSAGHMTVFPDGTKERLHGHNFQVAVTVELPADGFIAFARFKQEITAACEAWDERVMLPRLSPYLLLLPSAEAEVDFVLCGDHYVLPRRDVLWLDVDSVTTERLAAEFCKIIAVGMLPLWLDGRILSLAVQISETAGQAASFRMTAAEVLSLAAAGQAATTPRVSIVLSCYNKAETVAGSAKSVLAQTYSDLELVVVDDGSTDHSAQVLEGLKSDGRVRIVTTPNAGQAAALNLGVSLARGEYVGFIDADDEYHPEHVERLIGACERSDLDVAFAGIDIIQSGSQTHVVDFFDRTRLIPISEIDCVTGIIFGRRSVLAELGFAGDYLDIDLYHRVTTSALKWAKLERKTYRYYFGRCEGSNSARMVEEAGLGPQKDQA